MSKVIVFPSNEPAIEIERTEEFKSVARELSVFIQALPLTHEDNDKLIALIIAQVQQAEKDAFEQGFSLGLKLGSDLHATK